MRKERIIQMTADDLETDGPSVVRPSRRDGGRRLPSHVDWEGAREPLKGSNQAPVDLFGPGHISCEGGAATVGVTRRL